jgi:hypothetical protein
MNSSRSGRGSIEIDLSSPITLSFGVQSSEGILTVSVIKPVRISMRENIDQKSRRLLDGATRQV